MQMPCLTGSRSTMMCCYTRTKSLIRSGRPFAFYIMTCLSTLSASPATPSTPSTRSHPLPPLPSPALSLYLSELISEIAGMTFSLFAFVLPQRSAALPLRPLPFHPCAELPGRERARCVALRGPGPTRFHAYLMVADTAVFDVLEGDAACDRSRGSFDRRRERKVANWPACE